MGLAEDLKALQELHGVGEISKTEYDAARRAAVQKLFPAVTPIEPEKWRVETNDRYSKIVATIISLSTASLILPVLFLREFLGIPKRKTLAPDFNSWAYEACGPRAAA